MNELVAQFFTLSGMIIFFLGVASACLWHIVKQRYIGHREPTSYRTLGMICGVAALVFIGMQNTQLAAEVQACQREFNAAITARAAISEENDRLSREHRHWLSKSDEAIGDLIRYATVPTDPTIAALPVEDSRRQAWVSAVVQIYNQRTLGYRAEIAKIEQKQVDNEVERRAHPLPAPTCGSR